MHPEAGGAEVFVHEIAKVWTENGHQVEVFSSRVAGKGSRDYVDGVTIRRIGSLRAGSHHVLAPRIANASNPDVILESINTLPYQLPLRRGDWSPFVSLVHQMAKDIWHSHLPFPIAQIAERLEPSLYRAYRNRQVLAVSESTKADLHGAGLRDITVVPQGGIGPQPFVEKERDPTLMFVGRLASNKRPDHAVETFKHVRMALPSARLWLVGEGEMRSQLSVDLPPGVELLGRLSREELMARMGRAHLLIATSVREGWGLVVTEAAALGTPTVAYSVPGLTDSVVHEETGLLVPESPRKLAESVITLIKNPDRREAMSRRAADWGSRWSWPLTSASVFGSLQELSGDGLAR